MRLIPEKGEKPITLQELADRARRMPQTQQQRIFQQRLERLEIQSRRLNDLEARARAGR
jgi:hypothetical protein